jgi:trk system potassium uptake protein TrkH
MPFFFKMTPATRIILWFVFAILIGTVLLALPLSSESHHLPLIDSLFTAASAVCVTGLTVVNTASTFSTFGEIVILILIQMGGLGIMTFSTLFFVAVGERLSLGHRMTLKETFGVDGALSIKTILRAIFVLTVADEGIGAVFQNFS